MVIIYTILNIPAWLAMEEDLVMVSVFFSFIVVLILSKIGKARNLSEVIDVLRTNDDD